MLPAAQDFDAIFGGGGVAAGRVALGALAIFTDCQRRLFQGFIDGAQVVVGVTQLRVHGRRLLVLSERALRVIITLVAGADVLVGGRIVVELERRFVIGDGAGEIVIALIVFACLLFECRFQKRCCLLGFQLLDELLICRLLRIESGGLAIGVDRLICITFGLESGSQAIPVRVKIRRNLNGLLLL